MIRAGRRMGTAAACLGLLAAFLGTTRGSAEPRPLAFHFLPVGYGDAVLIQTPGGQNILWDAGSLASAETVLRYLNAQNVHGLDAAVVTHPHRNHFGGLAAVLARKPVASLYTNGDLRAEEGFESVLALAEEQGLSVTVLKDGDRPALSADGVAYEILNPAILDGSVNDNALVMRVQYKESVSVLTSDIGKARQDRLLQRDPGLLAAGLIQIPHHGAALTGSWHTALAARADPAVFVVSTGENEYGRPQTRQWAEWHGTVFRTDRAAAVVAVTDGKGWRVTEEALD